MEQLILNFKLQILNIRLFFLKRISQRLIISNFQLPTSNHRYKGQALITLLFFVLIGISVITAATLVLYANMTATTTTDQGQVAYYYAESGAEDAVLRLLRNPSFSGTYQALPSGEGYADVTVNSGTITSTGNSHNTIRKIQVQTTYSGGVFTITSWKEVN